MSVWNGIGSKGLWGSEMKLVKGLGAEGGVDERSAGGWKSCLLTFTQWGFWAKQPAAHHSPKQTQVCSVCPATTDDILKSLFAPHLFTDSSWMPSRCNRIHYFRPLATRPTQRPTEGAARYKQPKGKCACKCKRYSACNLYFCLVLEPPKAADWCQKSVDLDYTPPAAELHVNGTAHRD